MKGSKKIVTSEAEEALLGLEKAFQKKWAEMPSEEEFEKVFKQMISNDETLNEGNIIDYESGEDDIYNDW